MTTSDDNNAHNDVGDTVAFAPPNAAALALAESGADDLWWWDADGARWRTRTRVVSDDGRVVEVGDDDGDDWVPWDVLFDDSRAPFFRWYVGAATNACFNCVDRWLLPDGGSDDGEEASGREVALTVLEEDGARLDATRRALLVAVVRVAVRLRDALGARPRDRVLLHGPTDASFLAHALACQRLGVVYSATAANAVEDALTTRIEDLRPSAVLVPPTPPTHGGTATDCRARAERAVARTRDAGATYEPPVVLAASPWESLVDDDEAKELLETKTDRELYLWAQRTLPCVPCCASEHPSFASYTSGSTGKPKGIVHGHGAYVRAVRATMDVVFPLSPEDKTRGMLTVGNLGWITGQSYVLHGPLLAGVRSVVLTGDPTYPDPLRVFRAVASERCAILKTGAAVVRRCLTDPRTATALDALRASSRLTWATFCAEPVSAEVHRYAHRHVSTKFFNSYWATEHGGVVCTRNVQGDPRGSSIAPDARAWPLPWVDATVDPDSSDVVLRRPYPGLALTVWGDAENVRGPDWAGDLAKYRASYWTTGAFLQGDVARVSDEDARALTFHGRSDEVINVNGNRVATEEIERRLWTADGESDQRLALLEDCCVVGGPDFVTGTTPVAFAVTATRDEKARARLRDAAATAVREGVGVHAVPDHFLFVDALPKTVTGKTARRTLQSLLAGGMPPTENIARSREVMPPLVAAIREWRATGSTASFALDVGWEKHRYADHVVSGDPTVPAAGWLIALASALEGARRLEDVFFLRRATDPKAELRVVKRRRAVRVATTKDDDDPNDAVVSLKISTDDATPPEPLPALDPQKSTLTDDSTGAQHYRRCRGVGLDYGDAYRTIDNVEWYDHHFFVARLTIRPDTPPPAVLDAGLQIACASSRGDTFLPVGVDDFWWSKDMFLLDTDRPSAVTVRGEILDRRPDLLVADLRYSSSRDDAPFAVLGRARFARVASARPRAGPDDTPVAAPATASLDRARLRAATPEQRLTVVRSVLRDAVSDLFGREADFDRTVVENGAHSLHAAELTTRINHTLGDGVVAARHLAASGTLGDLAAAVSTELLGRDETENKDESKRDAPFPLVDYDTLNKIVRRRVEHRATVGQAQYLFPLLYLVYNLVKKISQFLRVGGLSFLVDPPTSFDLTRRFCSGRRVVGLYDLDLNRHFTVERIVERSVDGVEGLAIATGLTHVEQYYGRNLFASRVRSTFRRELAYGEEYEIRSRVTDVTGSLMEVRVEFVRPPTNASGNDVDDEDAKETVCFEILWTILIVLDSEKRTLLDWENVDLMEGQTLKPGPAERRR